MIYFYQQGDKLGVWLADAREERGVSNKTNACLVKCFDIKKQMFFQINVLILIVILKVMAIGALIKSSLGIDEDTMIQFHVHREEKNKGAGSRKIFI